MKFTHLVNFINVNPFSYIVTDWNLFGGNFGQSMLAIHADENGVKCKTPDGKIRFYVWGQLFTIRTFDDIIA